MRKRALNEAVKFQLQRAANDGGLALPDSKCKLAPINGRPNALAGDYHVGIWSGPRRTTQRPSNGLDEYYSVIVTVTLRINGKVPIDRLGKKLIDAADGADDFIDDIRLCIDQGRYVIMETVKDVIQADYPSDSPLGPCEPLRFAGDNGWRTAGPEWCWGYQGGDGPDHLVMDLRFENCRMVQSYIDDAEDT